MKKGVIPLLLLLSLATWFLYPGLFQGNSLVHGDNLNLGLPLLDLHQKIFSEGATAAWSNLIYGGHPLYAESQGGFSNPLNSIAVLLFEPVHANMVLRWLATILTALGVYSLSVSTNMLWGIASIDGNLALALARRMLVEDYIRAEVMNAPGTHAPGLRLMDYLGIRFIVSRLDFSNSLYDVMSQDEGMNVQVMENPAAHPRFQFYTDFAYVDEAEQAFSAIKTLERPQLLIETHSDSYKSFDIPIPATVPERAEVSIATHKASAIDYVFTIEANKPGWFFWQTQIIPDGKQNSTANCMKSIAPRY